MSKEQSFKLLDAFAEAGGNFIDTAVSLDADQDTETERKLTSVLFSRDQCNYQNEQSEQWIGEWMAARNNRDLMVIATKYVGQILHAYKVLCSPSRPDIPLIIAIGRSAKATGPTTLGTTNSP